MRVKKPWREPLVHFLLLGAAIFLFYEQTREVTEVAPDRIIVTGGQVEQLVANYKRTWMRAPTEDELNALSVLKSDSWCSLRPYCYSAG